MTLESLSPGRLRSIYFFGLVGIGIGWVFFSLLMRERGLGEGEIGVILAVGTLISGVLAWSMGRIIRGRVAYQHVLIVGALLGSLSLVGISYQHGFTGFLIFNACFSLSTGAFFSALPIVALRTLAPGREGQGLGRYRMFGSFGFMAGVYGMGWLTSFLSLAEVIRLGGVMGLLPIFFLLRTEPHHATAESHAAPPLPPSLRGPWVCLALAFFLFTMCYPSNFPFLGLYAKSLGASHWETSILMGANGTVAVVGLLLVGWMSDRFGPQWVLLVGFMCQPLRTFGYSLVDGFWWLLLPQSLHLFTFCAYEVCMPIVVSRWFGPDRQQALFGKLQGLNFMGMLVGSLLTGWLVDTWGYRPMFRVIAGIMVVALIGYAVAMAWRREGSAIETPGKP